MSQRAEALTRVVSEEVMVGERSRRRIGQELTGANTIAKSVAISPDDRHCIGDAPLHRRQKWRAYEPE
jgi:hypothetical protein